MNIAAWIMFLAWPVLVTTAGAQTNGRPAQTTVTASDGTADANIQEYVELLAAAKRRLWPR
jgi:hypothetical protein